MPQSSRNTLTGNLSFNLSLLLDHLEKKNIKTLEEESLLATLTNIDNISHKNLYDLREYIKKTEGLPEDFKKNRVLNIINGIFREDLKSKLEALINLVLADKQEVRARIASSSKGQVMRTADVASSDDSEYEFVSKEEMEGALKDLNKHIFFEDSGGLEVKVDDASSKISLVSNELHKDILEELENKYMGDKMRSELVREAKDFLFPKEKQSSSIKKLPGFGGNPGGVLLFGGALLGEEMKASDGQGPILPDAADKKEVEGAFARIKAWQNGGYKENSSMKEDLAIVLAKGDWEHHVVPLCESILGEHLGLEFNEAGLFNKLLSKNDNMLSYKDIRSDKKLCNFGSRTFFTTLLDKLEENEYRRNLYFKNNYDLKKIVENCKSTTKSNKSRGMFGSKTNDKQAEALDKIEKIIDRSNMELKK